MPSVTGEASDSTVRVSVRRGRSLRIGGQSVSLQALPQWRMQMPPVDWLPLSAPSPDNGAW